MSTSSTSFNSSSISSVQENYIQREYGPVPLVSFYIGDTSHPSQFAERSSLDGKLSSAASVDTSLVWLRFHMWVLFSTQWSKYKTRFQSLHLPISQSSDVLANPLFSSLPGLSSDTAFIHTPNLFTVTFMLVLTHVISSRGWVRQSLNSDAYFLTSFTIDRRPVSSDLSWNLRTTSMAGFLLVSNLTAAFTFVYSYSLSILFSPRPPSLLGR